MELPLLPIQPKRQPAPVIGPELIEKPRLEVFRSPLTLLRHRLIAKPQKQLAGGVVGVVQIRLDLDQGDRGCRITPAFIQDPIIRVLPALIAEPLRRPALILDEPIAVALAILLDPAQGPPQRRLKPSNRSEILQPSIDPP